MSDLMNAIIAAKLMGNGGGGGGGGLPSVTSADDGKALVVEDGAWAINFPSPVAVVWLMYDEVDDVSYIDASYDALKSIKGTIAVYSPPYEEGEDPYFEGNLIVCSGGFAYYIADDGSIFTFKTDGNRMLGIDTLGIDLIYQNGAWSSSMSYNDISQFVDGATEDAPRIPAYVNLATSSDFAGGYSCTLAGAMKFGPGGVVNGYAFVNINKGSFEFDERQDDFNDSITTISATIYADGSVSVEGKRWTITPTVTTL